MVWKHLSHVDPDVAAIIDKERERQEYTLELIASSNLAPPGVLEAEGSVFLNKAVEGYPGSRYFSGCEWVDALETLAIERAKQIFGSEHVNVQPHSGVNANFGVYVAALKPGDTVLALDLGQGGHLSHGYSLSLSGQVYQFHHYGLDPETENLNYDQIRQQALELRPRMIIAGGSAFPRTINFEVFADIAREVGAYLMVDMAHIAGLVAAGLHPSPVPHAQFVTHTCQKTMAGGRGGVIHCRKEFAKAVDRGVFPGTQGSVSMQMVAAKAVIFKLALTDEYRLYQRQVIANAKALAEGFTERGIRLVSGGTDNHLMLLDLRSKNISGKDAQDVLELAAISTNKNLIPYDPAKAAITSGIRVGSPALTSRGFKEAEMRIISGLVDDVLSNPSDEGVIQRVACQVREMTEAHPLAYDWN